MLNLRKQLLLSLLLSSSMLTISPAHQSFFEEMMEEMDQFHELMEKRFAQVRQELRTSMRSLKESPSISMKLKDAGIEITIPHIALKDRNFDAQFDQDNNLLTVSTPSGIVSIQSQPSNYNRTYITAQFKQKQEQEADTDKGTQALYMNYFAHASQTVAGEVEMQHPLIEYDAQTQELLIVLPQRKKIVTKIPVNFKEPKEDK